MKIYLAGRYDYRPRFVQWRRKLERRYGFTVTSRWINGNAKLAPRETREVWGSRVAAEDLADIRRADVLVLFQRCGDEQIGRGGRHVEFGYALGRNKAVVLVGPRSNIFHRLGDVHVVRNFRELVRWLLAVRHERRGSD